jgi:MFS family permease
MDRGSSKAAWRLIFLMGLVSLFADVTYEGARSLIPDYLTFVLGATVFMLGLVIGLGDFLGYALRLVTGPLADLWKKYWLLTFLGYGVNLFAVPLLALAGNWQTASLLVIVERVGKALRTPARDTILSGVSKDIGRGKAFGVHEVLDQVGAIVGPFIAIFALLLTGNSYRFAFSLYAFPALIALLILALAYLFFRAHKKVFPKEKGEGKGLGKAYWLYTAMVSLSMAGLFHVAFLLYRASEYSILPKWLVPSLFLVAMAVDAIAAIVVGLAYDRWGLKVLPSVFLLTAFVPLAAYNPTVFSLYLAASIFGIVLGMQETVIRAAVADLSPVNVRGRAYGFFNGFFGLSFLLGGGIIGFLYSISFDYVMVYVVTTQFASILLALKLFKELRNR